jgi:PAS domain S-box-containing protein
MGFRFKVIAAFAVALAMLLGLGILSYKKTTQSNEDQQWVSHTHLVLEKLDALYADLIDTENGQRSFILTGEQSYLQLYQSASRRVRQDSDEVRRLTIDNPRQQRFLNNLQPLIATRFTELQGGISVRQEKGLAAGALAIREGGGKQTIDALRAAIVEMKEEEQLLLRQRLRTASVSSERTRVVIVVGSLVALIFLLTAALVIFQEMLRRHKAEEALRQTEERFRLLVTGVNDYAIFMLDPEGLVATWNSGAERIKGYREEEILGKHFSTFYPAEDFQQGKPQRELATATREGRIEDEGWRIKKDGTRFWANTVITALRDEKGRLQGFGKVTRDMTERRLAEDEMEMRNAQLEAANKELQAFSYSVSHDLRSPLRAIDGFSLALLEDYKGKLDAEGEGNLQRIRAAAGRMGQLIDGMLNLTRISRAGMVLEIVDLSALAREIASELQASQPERQVVFSIAPTLRVKGDPRLLRAVLENLLNNAWKFTSRKPKARIELGAKENGGETVYLIRDNGAGFDMQYADKLFGVFQRLHRDTEFPGNGVGLATVQRIIQRHGGRIWAEAAAGEGATFFFVLNDAGM